MNQLSVTISLEINDEDSFAIAQGLGCDPDKLQQYLTPFVTAAAYEYCDMFSGSAVVSVSSLREKRLAAILKALPPDKFPTDEQIARLFNLNTGQSKALLRATLSRHRTTVRPIMEKAAVGFVKKCLSVVPNTDGIRQVRFPNSVIIEMLNAQLALSERPRMPIRRKANTFDTYIVSNGAFEELRKLYS